MRYLGTVIAIAGVLVSASMAKAQDSGNLVDLTLSVPQANQIYVADLDIQHIQSASVLFSATLRSLTSQPVDVKLKMTVDVLLANGESYPDIADATTKPFPLNAGQVMVITNVDFSGGNPAIQIESSHYNSGQVNQLKNVALATGKAPAGIYTFKVECTNAAGELVATPQSGQIIVTNPTRIELALPMDQGTVSTLYPHFQWSANVDTVILAVYEKTPSRQSPEDVVSGVPFLRMTVPNSTSPASGSFIYPVSGAGVRPLQEGETYYWYVEIPSSTSRGSGIRSDIWSFTVGSTDSTAFSSSGGGNINAAATQALKNFLSGTSFSKLAAQIATLTGQASYDGSTINMQELLDILKNMDKSRITNVTIQ